MYLKDLLLDVPEVLDVRGDDGIEIKALSADSRKQLEQGMFFCFSGANFDAHDFAGQAVENGSVALVVERYLPDVQAVQVRVSDGRAAMARIASAFHGHPDKRMRMVGVTGTKGKTTTTYLLKSICEAAGMKCGLIGTTGNMIGARMLESRLTTPDPIELYDTLHTMADEGVQVVCMEVSAHALALHKLVGMTFEAAAYTNLSLDHLDFFGTMEHYRDAKRMLFADGLCRNAAFNADEETTPVVMGGLALPCMTFGISENADLYARDIEITENGVSFMLNLRGLHSAEIHLKMTGMFNVYNALAATALAMILGIDLETIKRGLEAVRSVPGRIEMLETNTPYRMILDYSHSPDALDNILRTVRTFTRGRLIALFGCGGDRDRQKRPVMGRISGQLADLSVLTSDNPRREDPMQILDAIEDGIRETNGEYVVIENRREAIRYAMNVAREGDVIVLCGKGHETYQDIGGVKHPFDEKIVVAELLTEME